MRRGALAWPAAAVLAMSLAGCGSTGTLKPVAGEQLPAAPYGATSRPDVKTLLTPSVQARPQRNGDVLTRSQERPDDMFDLPPS
ncbi:hypothetical protein [Sphingomonas sp.]|jgi:hypothetical protein|uniref:hypothetical protein n=1 Tax=Sphingomonas sp. TaxID=28214 RepID=UPI0035C803E1